MVNKVDTLLNFKDASGTVNEIYPITKKENVQGLAEFISNSLSGYLPKSGGTLTGELTLKGEPTADLQAATKKYVDDKAPLIIDASTLTGSSSIINAYNLIYEAYETGRIVFLKNNVNYSVLTHCSEVQAIFSCESNGIVTETWILANGNMQQVDIDIKRFHHIVNLASANWDSATKAQTINAGGVTTTNIVTVSPATKASADIWAESGVFCAKQGDGTLKFTCTDIPTSDISVNVVIEGVMI